MTDYTKPPALEQLLPRSGDFLCSDHKTPPQYPVVYYSKTMIDTELNYLIYNKEMLAIVSSFKH
jgi:hypothetical protein